MTKTGRTRWTLLWLSLAAGLLLPTLTLVPLGSFWLWQHGLLIYWAIAATLLVALAFLAQRRLLPDRTLPGEREALAPVPEIQQRDPSWTPAEDAAWTDVLALAQRVDAGRFASREAALALAFETVDTVARRIHPEIREPVWHFTVPEALAVIERVSARLGDFTYQSIPLSDRITVAQALSLYRWRGTAEGFQKAYDVWRLMRLANPLTAATGEIREQLTRQMLQWGREHVTRRLGEAYVREVGRAAIDLYGGRLAVGREGVKDHVSAASVADMATASAAVVEPLRIMVAGQTSAGKSSLINAMAGEMRAAVDALPATDRFVPYELKHAGLPAALIIDSPGFDAALSSLNELVLRSSTCDLLLWVAPANVADREADRLALSAFRRKFAESPSRRQPPMLLILTNIDRLRPFAEWAPPYDLADASRAKSAAIVASMQAAATDLGFLTHDTVPVSLRPTGQTYNVVEVWARIVESLPEAKRAQLLRRIQDLKSTGSWGRLWSQTLSAGRAMGQVLKP